MSQSRARGSSLVVSVVALSIAGCGGGAPATCPSGWSADSVAPGGCRPSVAYTAGVSTRIGTGAYGFARTITGNCQPGDSSTCADRLEPGLQVQAFAASAIPQSVACGFTPNVAPAGTTTIDASGAFEMSLAAGDYAFVATDPMSHCPVVERATVSAGSDVIVAFEFDHAAY